VILLDRYGTVLRGTGAARPLLASLVGRLPLGMTGLAVLLLVRESTGSYAAAGGVSAAYALAFAVVSPLRARTAGPARPVTIVLLMGLLHPVALTAVVLLAAASAGWPALGARRRRRGRHRPAARRRRPGAVAAAGAGVRRCPPRTRWRRWSSSSASSAGR
jgi:hypothetical protein